jgi:hypothetical protein
MNGGSPLTCLDSPTDLRSATNKTNPDITTRASKDLKECMRMNKFRKMHANLEREKPGNITEFISFFYV